MKKSLSLLLAAALAGTVFAQVPRKGHPAPLPSPPAVKGLRSPLGLTERELIQTAIKDMPGGAVVVVEDEAFHLVPRQVVRFEGVRILEPAYTTVSGIPLAPWMDGPFVVSGGNTIAQVYCLGWGYR